MAAKLRDTEGKTNLDFLTLLKKQSEEFALIKDEALKVGGETLTGRVLHVEELIEPLPESILDPAKEIKYRIWVRTLVFNGQDTNLFDPCKIDYPKDQMKDIKNHDWYVPINKNLPKPTVGSLVEVYTKTPDYAYGSYLGLAADRWIPEVRKTGKASVESNGKSLAPKIPIEKEVSKPFQHEQFPPFSIKAKKLFEDAAFMATQHEQSRGFEFFNANGPLPKGIPAEWADFNTENGKALHEILKKESSGYVGAPNYSYLKAIERRDGGKISFSDWTGEKYAETWQVIIDRLKKGRKYLGTRSTASGLGQMILSNVKKFYPSGTSGVGDAYEEAAGMMLYIKSRYGTPAEAWAQYGGCSEDGKYSQKHIPKSKRGKPCNPPHDPVEHPGIAGEYRPNSPNGEAHDHEGY